MLMTLSWAAMSPWTAWAAPSDKLTPAETEFFEKHVRPLLTEHCYECHSSANGKVKGGLAIDTAEGLMAGGASGAVIVSGKPEQSLLIKLVRGDDPDLMMPPKKKLTAEQVAVLTQWVKMGAPDPRESVPSGPRVGQWTIEEGRRYWAFEPVRRPASPTVKDRSWAADELDRFVLSALEERGLRPVADADPQTLIRRAYFDLIGLPPSPAEIETFVKAWQSQRRQGDEPGKAPRVYEELIDRLLASPQFGERWGRHWLDVVRYAESTGMTRNYPYSHAWRYRDFVIDALNADKPYDRFIMEQIAGDLLPDSAKLSAKERDERLVATAFLALGPKDLNERNALQFTMDNIDEQIDVVGRSMLGLTISCARCHDHKFDPIPTADYYALAGIFKSTQLLTGYASKQGGGNRMDAKDLLTLSDEAVTTSEAAGAGTEVDAGNREAQIDKLQKQLATLKQQVKRLEDLKEADSRKEKDRKGKKANEQDQKQAKKLAQLRTQVAVTEGQIRKLTAEAASKPPTNDGKAGKEGKGTALAMGVREGKPTDSVIYLRGEVDKPGKGVPRGFVQVLSPTAPPEIPLGSSGRLELARWIASPQHPMTARVMVNRIWQHLMGEGIVASVDNFGITGERPSNQALLDHLASRFAAGDAGRAWSVKAMIRQVMLSRTYRMASRHDESNFNRDPENRFVWRQNRRRLEVEAMRDAMLMISGELDLARPVASPVAKFAIGEINNVKRGGTTLTEVEGGVRRSVYMPIIRSALPGMYELFDFAEPSLVTGERDVTTVATQALYMLNSPFVLERSRRFADQLLAAASLDEEGRIDLAYRKALGRSALSHERERAVTFLRSQASEPKQAWASFCQALFASAEFRYLN